MKEETQEKPIKTIAITATASPNAILPLPALRILIKQYKDLIIGHCLDFDVYSHYQGNDLDDGAEYVCSEIFDVVWKVIIRHLKEGTEEKMFDRSLKLGEVWNEFMNILRKERIMQLREQYDKLKQEFNTDKNEMVYALKKGYEKAITSAAA